MSASATVRTRAQQRVLPFRGTVDEAAPHSTFAVSVGDGSNLAEDQITVLPSPAPVFSLPASQVVKVGEPINFQVSPEDPAGASYQQPGTL